MYHPQMVTTPKTVYIMRTPKKNSEITNLGRCLIQIRTIMIKKKQKAVASHISQNSTTGIPHS